VLWDATGTGDCVFGGDDGVALEFGDAFSVAAAFSLIAPAVLALSIASENDIGGGGVVPVVVLAVFVGVVDLLDATRLANPARPCRGGALVRSSGDGGGEGC